MRDVADRAGVSIQTVSNIVNQRGQTSPATRERVLQALKELDYHPNRVAQSLRQRRLNSIGFLTVDAARRFLSDPFHNAVLSGIADIARDHRFDLVLHALSGAEEDRAVTRLIDEKRVDGLIVTLSGEPEQRTPLMEALADVSAPVVMLDQELVGPNVYWVCGDNYLGSKQATQYLLERGHQRIAFLGSRIVWPAVEQRERGWQAALAEVGLFDPELLDLAADWTAGSGEEATLQLIKRCSDITAILAGNDVLAIGVLAAARRLGRRVPDDLAVIGYDDFDFCTYVFPALTTVRMPGYDIGFSAAQLLIRAIEDEPAADRGITFPPHLIIRDSA